MLFLIYHFLQGRLLSSSIWIANYVSQNVVYAEEQLIKTNQQNILIRSLMLKNQRGDYSSKDGKGISSNDNGRKRAAEKALDSRTSSKKATTSNQVASCQETSKARTPGIQNMTVERLRILLKEKGLSLRGRKDELIARLKGDT
nr:uncharacterized protein LOC104118028 [Nicotiana tomentosiformis]